MLQHFYYAKIQQTSFLVVKKTHDITWAFLLISFYYNPIFLFQNQWLFNSHLKYCVFIEQKLKFKTDSAHLHSFSFNLLWTILTVWSVLTIIFCFFHKDTHLNITHFSYVNWIISVYIFENCFLFKNCFWHMLIHKHIYMNFIVCLYNNSTCSPIKNNLTFYIS